VAHTAHSRGTHRTVPLQALAREINAETGATAIYSRGFHETAPGTLVAVGRTLRAILGFSLNPLKAIK
jgi:hypothetical protein